MSDVHKLSAAPRARVGKGAARATRREGRIPGVIYGAKKDPLSISMDPRDLAREIAGGGFFATLYDVEVGETKERVLARDLQLHPLTDRPIHIDFLRVGATTQVTVQVPCAFINEEDSPGLKRGGVLNIVRYELELICRADAIPHQIEVDLTGLEINDSIHISEIGLPEGVAPTITDRDFTIASIAAPSVVAEEAAEAAEAEEAEAIEGEEGELPEGAEGEQDTEKSAED